MTFEEWFTEFIEGIGANAGQIDGVSLAAYSYVARRAWKAAKPQWQPVETAPDRVPVILFIEGGILVGEKVSSNFWAVSPIYESYKIEPTTPTHWMPLPEPVGDVT